MTNKELNLLVKQTFGEDNKGIVLHSTNFATQACIVEKVGGLQVVFTFTNTDGHVFKVDYGDAFSNQFFRRDWEKFVELLEGE